MPSELPAALQLGSLQLRQSLASDADFLRALYRDVRSDELAVTGWPPEAIDAFCQSQFEFQRQHYRSYYPEALHYLVERDGQSIGRLIVDGSADALRVVDISLLAAQRGQGLGSVLLRWLCECADAQQQPMALSVEPQNRARHLYVRLGFVQLPGDGLYLTMRREPNKTEPTE
ncbi:GNAT family N-acetyltransferase [Comamonas sp. JUb58]|uniref:GNAT family N-acetyltransferase n=1 Tax=Comamonas sp. JUb58 TaxID=2485114 RepID=UPI0010CFBFB2|nr:GNAT family N-acetyltransferase [Comamonas sp. JUb58]TDS76262.1 L-amino acid N-acyltransferase YncA [Comamonas sp. JUb58]